MFCAQTLIANQEEPLQKFIAGKASMYIFELKPRA